MNNITVNLIHLIMNLSPCLIVFILICSTRPFRLSSRFWLNIGILLYWNDLNERVDISTIDLYSWNEVFYIRISKYFNFNYDCTVLYLIYFILMSLNKMWTENYWTFHFIHIRIISKYLRLRLLCLIFFITTKILVILSFSL